MYRAVHSFVNSWQRGRSLHGSRSAKAAPNHPGAEAPGLPPVEPPAAVKCLGFAAAVAFSSSYGDMAVRLSKSPNPKQIAYLCSVVREGWSETNYLQRSDAARFPVTDRSLHERRFGRAAEQLLQVPRRGKRLD